MSRKSASSWVDRGEPAIPKLRQALAHYFERFDESDAAFLDEHATIVFGMVSADSTDVQIAGYLRGVVRDVGFPAREPLGTRLFAISMWHIAKCALVRDAADRVLRREVGATGRTPVALADWLAERLMAPEELHAYREHIDRVDDGAPPETEDSAYAD